jgi:DNA-binding transcriptional ArsR family regulator
MPRTREVSTASALKVEFVASVPLDLVNAMYFTSLAGQAEGIDDWPAQVRRNMRPDLLQELDFLFAYPIGEPGVMCALNDLLFAHPEAWTDLEALLRFVREVPLGVGEAPRQLEIEGLVEDVLRWWGGHRGGVQVDPTVAPRDKLARAVADAGLDVDAVLALYDRPEELRQRMLDLIQRFYDEHYRHDLPRRLPCLERSVAAHRNQPVGDIDELIQALCHRPIVCLAEQPGAYTQHIFAPSLDMGPWMSCADTPPIHGLYYPCEARFVGALEEESEETVRLARIHKALSDEQRLRILRLLRDGELYAQQIVERTGLHQSVVSRHLEFMKVVGLVLARRQSNMKFYSLNPAIRDELGKTLDLFLPAAGTRGQRPS